MIVSMPINYITSTPAALLSLTHSRSGDGSPPQSTPESSTGIVDP